MDDFFKKVRNNEQRLKNFEVEVDSDKSAGGTTAAAPVIKENQDSLKSDNLKLLGSVSKPEANETEVTKLDVIHKPLHTLENEEQKLLYAMETPVDEEPKPKVETEATYEHNDLEEMLEKVGDMVDFLS